MDEFNLASRFAQDDEEDQRPNRRKKKPRFRTGVGMEKPVEVEAPEEEGALAEEGEGVDMPGPIGDLGGMPEMAGPELPEEGEDEAFDALVSRLEGESASAGRARKRRAAKKPGNDSLRKEFADRM